MFMYYSDKFDPEIEKHFLSLETFIEQCSKCTQLSAVPCVFNLEGEKKLFGAHFRITGNNTDKEAYTRSHGDTYEKLKV